MNWIQIDRKSLVTHVSWKLFSCEPAKFKCTMSCGGTVNLRNRHRMIQSKIFRPLDKIIETCDFLPASTHTCTAGSTFCFVVGGGVVTLGHLGSWALGLLGSWAIGHLGPVFLYWQLLLRLNCYFFFTSYVILLKCHLSLIGGLLTENGVFYCSETRFYTSSNLFH
jgi:hypothetical protein